MEPRAEPQQSQDQGSREDTSGSAPPLGPLKFPPRPVQQQGQQSVQSSTTLLRPPPGGLTQSPEELTRHVGWTAMIEAVTKSATTLYPHDPQAVALIVATSLQPYMTAFAPRGHSSFPTAGR